MEPQTRVYDIDDYRVTPESVAQAKAECMAVRREVERQTGLRIRDDGTFAPLVIIGCPREGCQFAASATTDGRAVRGIVAHIVRAHAGTLEQQS